MKIKNLKDQDQEIKKSIKREVIYLILLEYSNSSSNSLSSIKSRDSSFEHKK